MRFIAVGDKSRYQFFREITEGLQVPDQLESYRSEWLSQHTIEVRNGSSRLNVGKESIVINSMRIPLYTSVIFPRDNDSECIEHELDNRIIIFDEFPFGKGSTKNLIERIRIKGKLSFSEVVLYCNNRTLLDTDVTTHEAALETAYHEYHTMGISACIYRPGEKKKFLFWRSGNFRQFYVEDMKLRIHEIRNSLKMTYDLEFDLMYEFEWKDLLENPIVLEKIVEYREQIQGDFIAEYYFKAAFHYCFVKKRSDLLNPIWLLYEKIISTIAVWDMDRDYKRLETGIETLFREKLCHISELVFEGDCRSYTYFLNETHVELDFKQRMLAFFHSDLKEFLFDYINCKINRVEELLDEAL